MLINSATTQAQTPSSNCWVFEEASASEPKLQDLYVIGQQQDIQKESWGGEGIQY